MIAFIPEPADDDDRPPVLMAFAPLASEARPLRRAVTNVLTKWQLLDLVDEATLLATEVFANAVVHAKDETVLVEVVIRPQGSGARFEFADGSAKLPVLRACDPGEDEDGRGLALVQALADDWGASQHQDGKTVWFRIGAPA